MDEQTVKSALSVYAKLCNSLEANGLKFDRHDDRLTVVFTMNGDDIPMDFSIEVSL